ncbi:MAG: flagellar biosynthetic protein FliO [Oscillospiraceae bacterium]|jgi:flagellar biosynthetic protein FliO
MGEVFTLIISLAGIIALIMATYFGLRWLNKRVSFTPGSMIKVIERANLGPDKGLMIISVSGKYMLLGVSQQHIEKICDLDKEEIDKLLLEKNNQSREPFAAQLIKAFATKKAEKGGDGNDGE